MAPFRDFIDETKEFAPGPEGKGFVDFVPAPEPLKEEVKPVEEVQEPKTEPEAVGEFVCEFCGFKAKNKLGLTSHLKKHQ